MSIFKIVSVANQTIKEEEIFRIYCLLFALGFVVGIALMYWRY